jgi:hypothetical protein
MNILTQLKWIWNTPDYLIGLCKDIITLQKKTNEFIENHNNFVENYNNHRIIYVKEYKLIHQHIKNLEKKLKYERKLHGRTNCK